MKSSFLRFFSGKLFVFPISLFFGIISAWSTDIDLSEYLPVQKSNYWSFVGTIETDEFSSDLNLRREVDGSSTVANRNTFRFTQEVIPSLSDALDDVEFLNRKFYETTGNGWLAFREEYGGKVLQYNRPAKILPLNPTIDKSNKYKTSFDS